MTHSRLRVSTWRLVFLTPSMEFSIASNLIALALYLGGCAYFINELRRQVPLARKLVLSLAAAALVFHGIGAYQLVIENDALRTGVFTIPTLFFWVINLLLLLSSLKKPLENLFVFFFPLAAIAIASSLVSESPPRTEPLPLLSHILLGIIAYGVITIATLQALVVAFQDYQLRHRHATGLVRLLPPLQTMESLLFELLWWGEAFLTLSIISGAIFLEDMFAQHLAHKTVFSIITWLIYAVLLWGHSIKGWRGATAIRWVLGGFVALWLAYFGAKFVYEVILG